MRRHLPINEDVHQEKVEVEGRLEFRIKARILGGEATVGRMSERSRALSSD